jgi:hypothetical protein
MGKRHKKEIYGILQYSIKNEKELF